MSGILVSHSQVAPARRNAQPQRAGSFATRPNARASRRHAALQVRANADTKGSKADKGGLFGGNMMGAFMSSFGVGQSPPESASSAEPASPSPPPVPAAETADDPSSTPAADLPAAEDPTKIDALLGEIHDCQDCKEVLEIAEDEAEFMTPKEVATAIYRIGWMGRRLPQPERVEVVTSSGFKGLLRAALTMATRMAPKELAQCAWALAVLKASNARILQAIAEAAAARTDDLCDKDMSQIVWALGCLQHDAGDATATLYVAAAEACPEYSDQSLAMLLGGASSLPGDPRLLLKPASRVVADRVRKMKPELLADCLYAFGRARFYHAALFVRASNALRDSPESWNNKAMCHFLWSCVRLNFRPRQYVIDAIATAMATRADSTLAQDLATLLYSSAYLARPLNPEALEATADALVPQAAQLSVISLCNSIWGIALVGECGGDAYAALIAEAGRRHTADGDAFEPGLLRQLYQGHLLARLQDAPSPLDAELRDRAAVVWAQGLSGPASSVSTTVQRNLQMLGVQHSSQQVVNGVLQANIAVRGEDGTPIALQLAGAYAYFRNDTDVLVGSEVAMAALLSAAGWRVRHVPVARFMWASMQQRLDVLAELLDKAGAPLPAGALPTAHAQLDALRLRAAEAKAAREAAAVAQAGGPLVEGAVPPRRGQEAGLPPGLARMGAASASGADEGAGPAAGEAAAEAGGSREQAAVREEAAQPAPVRGYGSTDDAGGDDDIFGGL